MPECASQLPHNNKREETMKHFNSRKSIATFLIWMTVIGLHAQDTMVTKSGDIKTVYNVEISSNAVFYKSSNEADAQIERIAKEDLFMIKRPDGTMYDLGGDQSAAANTSVQVVQSEEYQGEYTITEEAAALNRKTIEDINSRKPECTDGKEGNADKVFCSFGISDKSLLVNDDISIDLSVGYINYYNNKEGKLYVDNECAFNHVLCVKLKNRTSKTIYIDLGNTFLIRGDKASAYYVPSASTTSSTSGTGVGVNAGAVAGALGIGGTIGKLAGGVNVGGGSSSTTVNTTFSQRVIAIPPMASKELDYKFLFDEYSRGLRIEKFSKQIRYRVYFLFGDDIGKQFCKKYKYQIGEEHSFDESNSPLRFSVFVTYSFSEECSKTRNIQFDLYARHIIGYKKDTFVTKPKHYIKVNGCLGFSGLTTPSNIRFDSACSFPRP